ncbi:MAG: thiamine pyrophosphate-binding protein [Acidobacteriota bacterium]|nr:thiamine pyrophosphate-binding protein [Acidobacteriota bacterium]
MRFVSTVPGGMIAPLLDALHRDGRVPLITFGHEQAAAFAVDAVARLGGAPAVALATLGPGAVNLLNGIAGAWLDSVPAVFLVGQIQSYLQKGNQALRQRGFQEVDFAQMVRPVCRAFWKVQDPAEAGPAVDLAFDLCRKGRAGPVIVEIPFDIQAAPAAETRASAPVWIHPLSVESVPPVDARQLDELAEALLSAERPVLVAGAGVRRADAVAALTDVANRLGAPVCFTLHALDLLPTDDPLNAGMIGPYGHRRANRLVMEADTVLVLGARLDHGQTGADTVSFCRGRTVIRVDVDPGEAHRLPRVRTIIGDVAETLRGLQVRIGDSPRAGWLPRVAELRQEHPVEIELNGVEGLNPHEVVSRVVELFPTPGVIVVDLGQHTWWASQAARLRQGQRFIAATGLGCMGYSLGAGLGVALSGLPTLVVVGDGAALMNLQELETIRRNECDMLILVLDNAAHGMVREFQEKAFEGRTPASELGYSAPPFAAIARAWGVPSREIKQAGELGSALEWATTFSGPRLLHVHIRTDAPVRPSIPYGGSLRQMLPPISSPSE